MKQSKKVLSLLFSVIMVLGLLSGLTFPTNAEQSLNCLANLECTDEGHYTGNQGDSRVFRLDGEYFIGYNPGGYIENGVAVSKRNGNVGVDGTIYENGFEVWIARWNFGDNISWAYRTFKLDGKYHTLTGKSGLIKSYNTKSFDDTVYFYNGSDLIYSFQVTPSNYNFEFSVNIEGVDELKVEIKDNTKSAGGTSFALYDLFLDGTPSTDTDGDGLLDSWETEGLDYNGDGTIDLYLPAMGADPNVPDIFVEVDWMVRPQKKFLWWETQASRSMAPSTAAMRLVYNSFRQHGINLHIDVGPDSTDFVTGKKWGNLSGGNEIPYEENFDISTSWEDTVNSNFSESRYNVFKHCLFINQYDGTTSSGKANDIPGQFFVVANQDWVYNGGAISVGGTFMHELGHTLGLCHGGCDHEHYKPNYLSVMNYAFQTTGLVGTGIIGYSDYKLPDINESHINENSGVDPSGLTEGTRLGTTLFYRTSSQRDISPISRVAIDFNNNGTMENDISFDLNPGGNVQDAPIAILKGHEDWSGIIYKGGEIGKQNSFSNSYSNGITFSIKDEGLQEKTLEESLNTSTLATDGTGYIELLPSSLIADTNGQFLEFEVGNMSANTTAFTVKIQCKSLFDDYTKSVTVAGSKDKIESEHILIPVTKDISSDNYTITCSITSGDKTNDYSFIQEAVTVSEDDIEEMKQLLYEDNELTEDEVEKIESLIETYENTKSANACKFCGKDHGASFFGKLIAFFHKIAYFFAHLFGKM